MDDWKSLFDTNNLIREIEFLAKNSLDVPVCLYDHVDSIRRFYEEYETKLEINQALSIITDEKTTCPLEILRTSKFAVSECIAAGVTKDSIVAFIGSGPFPESALAIVKQTGCTCDCLDCSAYATLLARKVTQKIGAVCDCLHCNGQDIHYEKYTHIFVAALARPKFEILNRIANASRPDVIVICRSTQGGRCLVYEPLSEIPPEFIVVDEVHNEHTIVHSKILKLEKNIMRL